MPTLGHEKEGDFLGYLQIVVHQLKGDFEAYFPFLGT